MKALTSLAVLLLLAVAPLAGCDSGASDPSASDVVTLDSEVVIAYEGRLTDGTVFDSSPGYTFGGARGVSLRNTIRGFRDGVIGMREGESKTLTIAPEDGYGSTPRPGIPANSTLIFDVTVVDIR